MVTYEEVPEEIKRKYDSWVLVRNRWLEYAKQCRELYLNDVEGTKTNYTQNQIQNIEYVGNVPATVNYVYPILNQKHAILASVKPAFRVVSFDGRYREAAEVLDKMCKAVLTNSEALLEIDDAIKDMLTTGIANLMVVPKDYYTEGAFGVGIIYLGNENVILDCNCRRKSLADMEGFFIEKEITLDKAMQLYTDLLAQVNELELQKHLEKGNSVESFQLITMDDLASSRENFGLHKDAQVITNDPRFRKLRVREYYDKYYTTVYNIPDPETKDMIKVFAENMTPEEQGILLPLAQSSSQDIFYRRWLILGGKLINVEMMPITKCPLETTFYEWGGTPYNSYGLVHFIKGQQEMFDKAIQLMVLNGKLTNNAGWIGPKGAIAPEDKKKWENLGNNPLVLKEYVPINVDGTILRPERDQIQGISNYFITLIELLKAGMEYNTGISPIVQGTETRIEVFSTVQQYQSAAMQRISISTTYINQSLENLGNVLIQYLSSNVKISQNYSFFNDKPDEGEEISELQIAQELGNDIQLGKYKVMSIPGTLVPSQRIAASTEFFKISQSSPDPMERKVYAQLAVELADIPEARKTLKKLDVVNQLQSQVQQMQEALKREQELKKQMENRMIFAEASLKVERQIYQRMDNLTTKAGQVEKDIEIEKLKQQLKEVQKPEENS